MHLSGDTLRRIAELYAVEGEIRRRPPDERKQVRQARFVPLIASLHDWMQHTLAKVSRNSDIAGAMRYALGRWPALLRYCDDGLLEIDNNAAERALRAVALGRKKYLFAGSDADGRAAGMYSLIGSAKLTDLMQRHICALCSRALPTIPSLESKNFLPGIPACPALAILALSSRNRLGDPVMHWQLLDSSVFTAAAYLPAKRILYLRFRRGELYRYLNFPPDLYRDFLAADSKGQYFAHNIRDRFPCEHLPRSRSASASST